MKTSNKLLITLAALILLIPLSAMIYDSKNYVDEKDWKPAKKVSRHFNEALKGHRSIRPAFPFNSIKVLNTKDYHFNFVFIEDKQFGFKVSYDQFGKLKFNMNSKGELTITILDKAEFDDNTFRLFVYGHDLGKISMTNAESISLEGTAANLEVYAKNMERMNFNQESLFKKLTIITENVKSVSFHSAPIDELTAKISNGEFSTYETNFKSLDLNSAGKTAITFGNPYRSSWKDTIENLYIRTTGASTITMENVYAKSISGSLSDSTQVKMPVLYLKQLIKQ